MNHEPGRPEEFIKFAIVGRSGVAVNMGLLFILTRWFSLCLEIAFPIEVSILTNFTLNNLWTFGKRDTHIPFWSRLFSYHLVTGLAGSVNYLVLLLLVKTLGMHDMISRLPGILIGTVITYSLNSQLTWRVR